MSWVACTMASAETTSQKAVRFRLGATAATANIPRPRTSWSTQSQVRRLPNRSSDRAPEELEGDRQVKQRGRANLRLGGADGGQELGPHLMKEAPGEPLAEVGGRRPEERPFGAWGHRLRTMVEPACRRRQFFRAAQFGSRLCRVSKLKGRWCVGDVQELDDRALVRALRALGDTTRFRMVQEIAADGELCCGQVAERFDVTQPTISHHLKVLCAAGVLSVRSQGKHRYISVNQPLLSNLAPSCRRGSCRRRGRGLARREMRPRVTAAPQNTRSRAPQADATRRGAALSPRPKPAGQSAVPCRRTFSHSSHSTGTPLIYARAWAGSSREHDASAHARRRLMVVPLAAVRRLRPGQSTSRVGVHLACHLSTELRHHQLSRSGSGGLGPRLFDARQRLRQPHPAVGLGGVPAGRRRLAAPGTPCAIENGTKVCEQMERPLVTPYDSGQLAGGQHAARAQRPAHAARLPAARG